MKLLIFQFVEHEGPGRIAERSAQLGIEPEIVKLYDGVDLPALKGCDGVMVLGGPHTVYDPDRDPMLDRMESFIEEVLDKDIPYYGICLGGQLLASVLGAPVRRNPLPEIGFYEVELTAEGLTNPIFKGIPSSFPAFEWHGDTFDMPNDCLHLAGSELCDNQAFSYRDRQFAVQFDIQATPEMVDNWLAVERTWVEAAEPPVDSRHIQRLAREYVESMKLHSFHLFNNFLSVIEKR
ncbi:type 1 glutamine amidotransferase [candidate division KSB1 bacterium]